MKLTKKNVYHALQDFFNQVPFVLFATGTSCAVDLDFGMVSLEEYLKSEIPKFDLTSDQALEWANLVEAMVLNSDFESAMNAVQDIDLLNRIIGKTAEHVSNADRKNAFGILNGDILWPAINMFERLVEKLPENNKPLHVATPNYDLLAEYVFARAEIPYTTGFWGGALRSLDWARRKGS